MNVLHYAGISENKSSGVSVIIPEILNSQANLMNVCLYNYGTSSFKINADVEVMYNDCKDDYHTFNPPFNKPDLVIFHSPFGIRKSIHISLMLRKEKIPYIVVPHGCFSFYALRQKKWKKILAMNVFFKRMFMGAKAIQFLSWGEQLNSIYSDKGIIIPNGIKMPIEIIRNTHDNKIKLSFIGRKDIYHKGLDLLIKACGKIHEELKKQNVHIYLYGPYVGNSKEHIKQLIIENSVEEVIDDCPPVYEKEKEKVFQESDIVALTSRFEGLPGAVLEAWSYGCPTLLTVGTNMSKEAIEHNCGWQAKNEVSSIKDVLLKIIENPSNIKIKSDAAIRYVREKYDWTSIGEKYLLEYEKILKDN